MSGSFYGSFSDNVSGSDSGSFWGSVSGSDSGNNLALAGAGRRGGAGMRDPLRTGYCSAAFRVVFRVTTSGGVSGNNFGDKFG